MYRLIIKNLTNQKHGGILIIKIRWLMPSQTMTAIINNDENNNNNYITV